VEATQEARTMVVREATSRLQREYDERLLAEQKKHRQEIEKLQVCIPCHSSSFTHGTQLL